MWHSRSSSLLGCFYSYQSAVLSHIYGSYTPYTQPEDNFILLKKGKAVLKILILFERERGKERRGEGKGEKKTDHPPADSLP